MASGSTFDQWRIRTPLSGATPIGNVDESENPAHPVGTCVEADHPDYGGGKFVYLLGVASVGAGDFCFIDGSNTPYQVTRASANGIGQGCVATADIVADRYGWFQVAGTAIVNVGTGFADNNAVYLTSTAGQLDDTVVAGDLIHGAKSAAAIGTPAAGQGEVFIWYPFATDGGM